MKRKLDRLALTIEEWRGLDPTGNDTGPDRPYTDHPIGAYTDGDRQAQALRSSIFNDTSITPCPGWKAPEHPHHGEPDPTATGSGGRGSPGLPRKTHTPQEPAA